jgi:hypothetical protein
MIGELFNAVVDEVIGDDPATRQSAALPYIFAKASAFATSVGPALKERLVPKGPAAPTL